MAKKRKSNTMEFDAAAAGARTRARSLEDDFIVVNDDFFMPEEETEQEPVAANEKKSKKPLIIAIVAVLIVALIGAGGFTWYLYERSGSSTIVSDGVFVNGVALGGKTVGEAETIMKELEDSLADKIGIHITAGDKEYRLTKENFKYSFNTDEILSKIRLYSEEKKLRKDEMRYEIVMQMDTSNVKEIVDSIADELSSKAANAKVSAFEPFGEEMFTYQKETVGKALDSEDLVTKLNGMLSGGSVTGNITATVNDVQPKITVAYLQDHIVKLSEFSTYSTNNANGNENMRLSLNSCNGSIIEPGETWSFNSCTGNSNDPELGYKPAGVLVQGRSETGIGGGICQSSTTIYNAGLLCGMEVVERACHYYKSTYVDAGRDATIDYGNIDLRLKNPFGYQLFMKCWMDGTELNCQIFGLQSKKFDSIEISTSSPDYFSKGYTVSAWRTYYLNGEAVLTEDLPSSTYYTSAPGSNSDRDSDNTEATSGTSGGDDSDEPGDSDSDGGDSGSDGGDSGSDGGDSGSDGGDSGSDGGDSGSDGGDGGSDGGGDAGSGGDTDPVTE